MKRVMNWRSKSRRGEKRSYKTDSLNQSIVNCLQLERESKERVEILGTVSDSRKFSGILRDSQGFSGILRGSQGFHGLYLAMIEIRNGNSRFDLA